MIGSLSGIRLWGTIAAGLAFVALCWLAQDRFVVAGKLDALRAEVKACESLARPASLDPASSCSGAIGKAIYEARMQRACDVALTSEPNAGRFLAQQSCTGPVKRLVAERDVATATAASARLALDQAMAGTAAAVARAEARGLATTQRRDRADAAIAAAPGTGDRRRCDAECLRALD